MRVCVQSAMLSHVHRHHIHAPSVLHGAGYTQAIVPEGPAEHVINDCASSGVHMTNAVRITNPCLTVRTPALPSV